MEKVLDQRGQACPKPVMATREALQDASVARLRVLVDDEASAENVRRMAASMGCSARVERSGAGAAVLIERTPGALAKTSAQAAADSCRGSGVVVLFASSLLGEGDPELGRILMRSFVKTLREARPLPSAAIFVNSGVRLTTEGSPLLEDIAALEAAGVEVTSCGTCLDFYGLKDRLRVGRVTNMFEIVSKLTAADRVVRP